MLKDYKIKYVSSQGVELNLSGGGIDAIGNAMPAWEFEAVTLNDRIVGLSRKLPEIEFGVVIVCGTEADGIAARNALYEVPAADRASETPGRLYLNDWYLTGYMTASTPDNWWQTRTAGQYVVKFVATDPLWTREKVKTFTPTTSDGLDYPFDFAYDFASSSSTDTLTNENYAPSLVRIAIQGAAENPTVTIGGNEYGVDVSIDEGEYLEIDPVAKTIEVVGSDGARRNVFDKRHGVQVLGSGSYIFEKVPTGELPVIYSNGLTFSVTVIEQRAEPRWS